MGKIRDIGTVKLILVHIPKTAGSSIFLTYKNEIFKYWGHNTRENGFISYPDHLQKEKKSLITLFKNCTQKRNHFYSFAVIRNTWERVFSSYNYLSKGGLELDDHVDFRNYIQPFDDFNDFVMNGLERAYNEQIHFRSQLVWIADDKLKIKVDKLLNFENIDNEMKELMMKFSYTPKDLMIYNQYNSLNFRQIYSKKSVERVADIYKDEIFRFGFKYF